MNIICIAGNLGRDAEIRSTPQGDQVVSFSIGDNSGKDKPTLWWNCQFWGKRAVSVADYLRKGQSVTVAGVASEREWTDKEGNQRKSMDIRVYDVSLQGGRSEAPAPAPAPRQQQRAPAPRDEWDDGGEIPF